MDRTWTIELGGQRHLLALEFDRFGGEMAIRDGEKKVLVEAKPDFQKGLFSLPFTLAGEKLELIVRKYDQDRTYALMHGEQVLAPDGVTGADFSVPAAPFSPGFLYMDMFTAAFLGLGGLVLDRQVLAWGGFLVAGLLMLYSVICFYAGRLRKLQISEQGLILSGSLQARDLHWQDSVSLTMEANGTVHLRDSYQTVTLTPRDYPDLPVILSVLEQRTGLEAGAPVAAELFWWRWSPLLLGILGAMTVVLWQYINPWCLGLGLLVGAGISVFRVRRHYEGNPEAGRGFSAPLMFLLFLLQLYVTADQSVILTVGSILLGGAVGSVIPYAMGQRWLAKGSCKQPQDLG